MFALCIVSISVLGLIVVLHILHALDGMSDETKIGTLLSCIGHALAIVTLSLVLAYRM